MKLLLLLLCTFSITFHPIPTTESRITGTVIKIVDGDTFDLLAEQTTYRIRLSDIDCPERKQDYYQKCKDALANLCFNKIVTVINTGKDRYGRIIGKVYTLDGLNVNQELVRTGFAWNFIKYSTDLQLIKLEIQARKSKLGLWSQPNPIAPWEYRQSKKKITTNFR